jgi:hypothetical protein
LLGFREDSDSEQGKITIGVLASDHSHSQIVLLGNGRHELLWLPSAKNIELISYASRPSPAYLLNVSTKARETSRDVSVSTVRFFKIVPRWHIGFSRIANRSSRNENHIVAKCGNLAYVIEWNVWPPISSFTDSMTVSREGNFVLREVSHPDRAALDLGYCRVNREDKKESRSQNVHVILQFCDTSLAAGDKKGRRLFSGVGVFMSWDERRWFKVLTTR